LIIENKAFIFQLVIIRNNIDKANVLIHCGDIISADLGNSSEYSSENLEGRSGEGFHVNSNWS